MDRIMNLAAKTAMVLMTIAAVILFWMGVATIAEWPVSFIAHNPATEKQHIPLAGAYGFVIFGGGWCAAISVRLWRGE